ncbi:hypothetical protein [Halopenitus persicus]|uniref:hypothetical protein n=1 Tax=Halopenitus persicus TaxID=1048396 RepID=UPI0012FE68E3|nr:hypothetical protein [Halopenitus persicus]
MLSTTDIGAVPHPQVSSRIAVVLAVALLLTGFVAPAFAAEPGTAPRDPPANTTTSTSSNGSSTATPSNHPVSGVNGSANASQNATSYAPCTGKGPIRGAICNVIENAKRSILGGALDATQKLARSTVELILRRPVPMRGSEIVVFRPPTNQPLAGAYNGWTSVGLPLGFLVWIVGAGVALASRFRPEATFATQGFLIEQNLVRNLLLTLGSWWVGAFILHLANGLILAVAPRGNQLVMGPQSGIGTLLGTGLLAGLLWVATAAIVTILLISTLLAYFLCLTFMVFLPVFSALMLFDTGSVMQTIGHFGQKGWSIFIRAAFFPLPAALVLGAGAYIATGTMGFVESAVGVAGFSTVAGTIAFAIVTFVTQLAALVATLWMLLGSRAARTAGGIMAGIGGAAMYSRAKSGAKTLAGKASMPNVGGASSAASAAASSGIPSDLFDRVTSSRNGNGSGAALGAESGTNAAGAIGPGTSSSSGGGLASVGTPTGGRPSSGGTTTGSSSSAKTDVSADAIEGFDLVVVDGEGDLSDGQRYQPGYVSDGEFQPIESKGQTRQLIVREHDRFAAAYDSDGDHPGVLHRGEDGILYDTKPVAGEDWGVSAAEETQISRDSVFDARGEGGSQ